MLSGVALKGDHGGVGNEGGTRISNESDGIE